MYKLLHIEVERRKERLSEKDPVYHISHESLGKGSQGNPIRPIRDY